MKELTKGSILPIILSFTLPIFIGNLFNQFYMLADTRIVGTYLGNDALAAVGSVSTLSDLVVNFIIGLANGFAVIIARHFGMGDRDSVRHAFASAISLGLVITGIIMLVSLTFLMPILSLINVSAEHLEYSAAYISIIFAGLIFTCLYNLLAAGLRATGDAYTPLFFLIFSAGMNVVLDLIFIGRLGAGVKGAAFATVISQLLSVVLCLIYTYVRYPELRFRLGDFIPGHRLLQELLPAGFSMGIMQCLVSFGTLALQGAINTLGTNTIVAHSATRKMSSLYMMPFSSLGTTMATFAGQNYGAGRLDRVRKGLVLTLAISYVWCLIVQVLTYLCYPLFITAITDTDIQEVIDIAWRYQKINVIFYVICPTICIVRNTLQGIGDHITPIISSAMELIGKLAIALIFTPIFAYWAVIWSEPIVWIIMVIPLLISIIGRLRGSEIRKEIL